jgi:hypothetical protein
LIFDVPPFDVAYLARWTGPEREFIRYRGTYQLPGGVSMRVLEQTEYDQASGVLTARFTYERLDTDQVTREVRYRELRLYPRRLDELVAQLELAAFTRIDVAHRHLAEQHVVSLITARFRPEPECSVPRRATHAAADHPCVEEEPRRTETDRA